MIYKIAPVPKPRMTQRDKWRQRPCVMKYRAFKDDCRASGIKVPLDGCHVIFIIPMPKSWSKAKKIDMDFKPHQSKPDIDNLLKALLDAVYLDDSLVWKISCEKRWGHFGKISIVEEKI